MFKNLILGLAGPTASGKTHCAIELLKHYPIEIISVDSAMIYRGMNIGTSKPDAVLLKEAPHRLIDILDPAESYSAAQFCQDVRKEIASVRENNRIPLLVGGTMLYFRAFQQGLSDLPSADPIIRDQLLQEALVVGWPEMHKQLMTVDPTAAQRIHAHDSQRIQRALEVYRLTGLTLTDWQQKPHAENSQNIVMIGLMPSDRQALHQRIANRFHVMLTQGLVEEVTSLFQRKDLNLKLPSIRSVGYRQIWEYLQGRDDYSTMIDKSIAATRQLAKRQLTWLRSWPNLIALDSESPEILTQLRKTLEKMK